MVTLYLGRPGRDQGIQRKKQLSYLHKSILGTFEKKSPYPAILLQLFASGKRWDIGQTILKTDIDRWL